MKLTKVQVRLFEYAMPRPFHPTWQPLPTTPARIHLVEVHTDEGIVGIGSGALKLRFHSADWRDDVKTLAAVRKAVGDRIDIMVDANWGWRIAPDRQPNRWDLKTAIAAARAMEEYGVYWLEEPLDAYDYD